MVLIGILSTLGPAQSLAQELRARNLLRLTMAAVLAPTLLVLAWRWIRTRPGKAEVAVALGTVFVFLWAWARVETPEERTHLLEYGILTVLVHRALLERQANGRLAKSPAVLAVVISVGLGLLDEGVQLFLPNRVFDWRDIGFNVFAVAVAMGARLAVAWVRRRRAR